MEIPSLVISPLILGDPPNGGTLRTWAAAAALARIGRVVVVAPTGSHLPPGLDAELVTAGPTQPDPARRLLAHAAPGPLDGRFARMGLGSAVRQLLETRRFGFALLEHSAAGWAFGTALARSGIPWALDLHNVDAERSRTALAETRSILRRSTRRVNARWVHRAEQIAIRSATVVVAVSEDDERYAISAGARATIPCPNGVDPRLFDVPPPPSAGSWLFVGDLGYGPNERGLLWFASRVAPRLPPSRRRTIRIVGRRPTKRLRECARETGLELHADVPDIGPFLAGSAYCFTPVREGAGTSLKVLEYAAAARPIVSTAVGGRGHPFRDLIAVADDSSRFADAMDELERDDRVAAETGRLLRERARDLTWDKMFEPLVGVALGARVS